jgi:hypothetical protein
MTIRTTTPDSGRDLLLLDGRRSIYESPGYFSKIGLSEQELARLREIITHRWLGRIGETAPNFVSEFSKVGVERYHEVSDLIDHGATWNKDARVFSREEVREIIQMSLFSKLKEIFGSADVADIEGLGYPEIYWRLVRPGNPQDVSGIHADSWFYSYTNELSDDQQAGLIKVWVAVFVAPGHSGLMVMADSHKKNWPNHSELRHGRMKPVLDVADSELDMQVVATEPGEAIVFNTHLLHGGIPHTHNLTRVNIEFAIRVPNA